MFFSPETLLVDSENVAIAIEILDKTLQGEGIHLSEEELAWEAVSYLNFLLAMNILPISLQKNVALQNHIAPIKELLGKNICNSFFIVILVNRSHVLQERNNATRYLPVTFAWLYAAPFRGHHTPT